jgi:hypothetical protein
MTINTTREMVRAPMGVKAVATSDQSIQVWWEAVPVRVKINGYRVYYTMTAVEDLNQWNIKDVPATESTDLANLEKMAQYAIAVTARIDNVNLIFLLSLFITKLYLTHLINISFIYSFFNYRALEDCLRKLLLL